MRDQSSVLRYACYYGIDRLETLAGYDLAILQPEHYTADEIGQLSGGGTRCIGYVSLGEAAPDRVHPSWRLTDPLSGQPAIDARWRTAYLDCRQPGWQDHLLLEAIPPILNRGYCGLFLDTLDVQERFPETRPAVVQLLRRIRAAFPAALLFANRGFSVLDAIEPSVDAFVFECFTSYLDDGRYHTWNGSDLQWTERQAQAMQQLAAGRPILALDYAAPEDVALRHYAQQRALDHGFHSFVGPSGLDWLPPGSNTGA